MSKPHQINVKYEFGDDGSSIQILVSTDDGSAISTQAIVDALASTMEDLAGFQFYPVSEEQLKDDTELN